MKLVPIGEVCEINPRLPKAHGIADDAEVSFVPMAAVSELFGTIADRQVRCLAEVKKGYTSFLENDVLFAKITPCMENGKAAIARGLVGGVGFGSTEFHVLRPHDLVIPEWIHYFVRREAFRQEAKRNFTGTAGQQRVPTVFMERALIPVPNLDEQRRIVDLLTRAEGIVRLRREAQKKAAEIIPALFLDMFGDGATNPKRWPVERLGDIANVVSGITKGRKLNGKQTRSVPYLRVANVQAGFLDLGEVKKIEATDAEIEALKLQSGDVVLTEGGDYDKLGRGAQWRGEIEPCIHQNHIFRVRLRRDVAAPDYFEAYLQTAAATRYFLSVAKRTTNLASINMTQLRNLPVMLPTVASQRVFVQRAEQIRSIRLQERTATLAAEATFSALLAKVFASNEQNAPSKFLVEKGLVQAP